ncbi:MAG: hypothetical protein KDJ16_04105, partial [Hyphomicrobiales bacterium]|nr:hypothetical protein [Hyphomicrobiales bacterium]
MGTAVCAACHDREAQSWTGSDHALAWTDATPDHVLGDFNSASFAHNGERYVFLKDDDGYFVEADRADGSRRKFPVVGVAGIRPLQQYLFDMGNGRLQALDIAWDTGKKRWYHVHADQNLPAGNSLHWTGPYKTWNSHCAECHATGFKTNYDPGTRAYHSTSVEIGVGCEACHGPGEAHVAW